MTAEVAVANKLAVALAADSIVTVGRGREQKTYDTVNKLFTLSKFHPVGIMVYGNAEFMQFPWETIIKTYRSKLGSRSFPTVKDYADDLFRYITNDLSFGAENFQLNVFMIVLDKFMTLDKKNLLSSIQREIKDLGQKNDILLKLLPQGFSARKEYKGEIKEVIRGVIDNADLTLKTARSLFKLAELAILKDDFSSYMSGVVFAGFGNDESFPTVIDYSLDGIISTVLKRKENAVHDATRISGAYIKPYAQREMVDLFMEGVDPQYQRFVNGLIVRTLYSRLKSVLDKYHPGPDADKEKELKDTVMDAYNEHIRKCNDRRKSRFADPIMNMLDSLPKDELARLAESLVSLTSVRRRVSEDAETVGGPIDVAVISKGDGFIWIRRKHYFDAHLNPAFFGNYLNTEGKAT